MGRRIDPSWRIHLAISRSSQCSMERVAHVVAVGFLSRLPYV